MIGLPTIANSRMSSRLMPAVIASWATSPFSALRTAAVISPAPSGCIIAYETRLIRSSPKRICGFITPWLARTDAVRQVGQVAGDRRRADVDRDAVRLVVEARPDARHASVPSWTATVTAKEPFSSAGWRSRMTARSASRSVRPHSVSSASNSRTRSPDGEASSGGTTST